MPYKSLKARRACKAMSMKRSRIYQRALANNLPEALAAEQLRDPMRPANELLAEIKRLPKEERQGRAAEYNRVLQACLDARPSAKKRYAAAREKAIEAQRLAELMS